MRSLNLISKLGQDKQNKNKINVINKRNKNNLQQQDYQYVDLKHVILFFFRSSLGGKSNKCNFYFFIPRMGKNPKSFFLVLFRSLKKIKK